MYNSFCLKPLLDRSSRTSRAPDTAVLVLVHCSTCTCNHNAGRIAASCCDGSGDRELKDGPPNVAELHGLSFKEDHVGTVAM